LNLREGLFLDIVVDILPSLLELGFSIESSFLDENASLFDDEKDSLSDESIYSTY
jgi:hypothetical protein